LRFDDGRPVGRVDVAWWSEGDVLVSWLEQTESGAEVRLRRVAPGGRQSGSMTVAPSSVARSTGFPRLQRAGDRTAIVWRDAGEPARLHTALIEAASGG